MIHKVISALIDSGWPYSQIARATGVCETKLRTADLTEKQEDAVLRVAAVEAKLDLDEILGE